MFSPGRAVRHQTSQSRLVAVCTAFQVPLRRLLHQRPDLLPCALQPLRMETGQGEVEAGHQAEQRVELPQLQFAARGFGRGWWRSAAVPLPGHGLHQVVARADHPREGLTGDRLALDLCTVADEELPDLAAALRQATGGE